MKKLRKRVFSILAVLVVLFMAVVPVYAASIGDQMELLYRPSIAFTNMIVDTASDISYAQYGNVGEQISFDITNDLYGRTYTDVSTSGASNYDSGRVVTGLSSKYYGLMSPATFLNNPEIPSSGSIWVNLDSFTYNYYPGVRFKAININSTGIALQAIDGTLYLVYAYDSGIWLGDRVIRFDKRNLIDRTSDGWKWFTRNCSFTLDTSDVREMITYRVGNPIPSSTSAYVESFYQMKGTWAVTDPRAAGQWSDWSVSLYAFNQICDWNSLVSGDGYLHMCDNWASNSPISQTYNVWLVWTIPVAVENDDGSVYYGIRTFETSYSFTGTTLYLFNMDTVFDIENRSPSDAAAIRDWIGRAYADPTLSVAFNIINIQTSFDPLTYSNGQPTLVLKQLYDNRSDTISSWYKSNIGTIATSPSNPNVSFVAWLNTAVGGFLRAPLFGTFSLGDVSLWILSLVVVFAVLKYFAGG